jgi:hypothetical protein
MKEEVDKLYIGQETTARYGIEVPIPKLMFMDAKFLKPGTDEGIMKNSPLDKPPDRSILQPWVMQLGLRHQGVLLTGVRGCDTAPKDDPSKKFIRAYRAMILEAHCGDPSKARSFIEKVGMEELLERFHALRRSCDHYPHHYLMHLLHAMEIIGYKHPDSKTRFLWYDIYSAMCISLHMNPEREDQLDSRLNADEATCGSGLAS